jgi:thioredoxin-related protein
MFKKGPSVILAVMIFFIFTPMAMAAVEFKKYDEALSGAAAENKHVMLYFWADWCRYCAQFNAEILPNDKVVEALNKSFLAVMINVDEEPELAAQYDAKSLPMVVFLEPGGKVAGFLPGFLPPDKFLQILGFVRDKKYLPAD